MRALLLFLLGVELDGLRFGVEYPATFEHSTDFTFGFISIRSPPDYAPLLPVLLVGQTSHLYTTVTQKRYTSATRRDEGKHFAPTDSPNFFSWQCLRQKRAMGIEPT